MERNGKIGFIVESFGGNTLAGADFLREAVKRLDLNGGDLEVPPAAPTESVSGGGAAAEAGRIEPLDRVPLSSEDHSKAEDQAQAAGGGSGSQERRSKLDSPARQEAHQPLPGEDNDADGECDDGVDKDRSKRGRRFTPGTGEAGSTEASDRQHRSEDDSEKPDEGHSGAGERDLLSSPERSDEEEGEAKRDLSKRVAESDLTGPRPKAARTGVGGGAEEGPLEGEVDLGFLLGDALDQAPLSVVLLVPDTQSIIADIIGRSGVNIAEVEKKSGSSVQVERGAPVRKKDRKVVVMGGIKANIIAQQIIMGRVRLKEEGMACSKLRLVVPNNIVRHLIGKGGCTISKIEEESGAHVQFQQEAEMEPGALGRILEIAGAGTSQSFALYLFSRKMVDDKCLPQAWRGENPLSTVAYASVAMMGVSSLMRQQASQAHGQKHLAMGSYVPVPPGSCLPVYNQQQQHGGVQSVASTMAQPSSVQGQALRPSRPYNLPQQQQQSQGPVSVQQVVENLNREVAATCTSVEMTVPDGAVRFCIGKQGASISMIQKQSRAHFDFAKECAPNSQERVVTITGTLPAIQLGISLLTARVTEWRSSLQFHSAS